MSPSNVEKLDDESSATIENEIHNLERKLEQAKARLRSRSTALAVNGKAHHESPAHHQHHHRKSQPQPQAPLLNPANHFLLLLSDSALPLGSFAFSSGLESYLAHNRAAPSSSSLPTPSTSFNSLFLPLSVSSYASTTLPFLLAAHRHPPFLTDLDDALDASVICTVGRRASVAQGRALLGIWERSFSANALHQPPSSASAAAELADFSRRLRTTTELPVSAHLAPLFGVVARAVGLDLRQAAYVFVLGHVKALISAAVRASLFGPYAAQKVLADGATQAMIAEAVAREWDTAPEEAGQAVPVMDLWVGRHEVLYSRIFNS